MTKKKASMSQVLTDIKPYITKKFMAAPCVKEQDIQAICQILLLRCKNVQLMQGLTNNKPDFRIQVKGLFGTEEKRFEVDGGDKKRPATKKKFDLGWIERLEEMYEDCDDRFAFIAGYTDGCAPFGVMWEEVGIDPRLPFEEKVKLYHMQMLG